MNSFADRRVWIGGGVVAAMLIAAAAWFLLISPELSSGVDLRGQAASTRDSNNLLSKKVAALKNKSANLGRYTTALNTALESLPYDSGLPAFTRQLSAQASASNVSVGSIVVGTISAATPAVPATGADTGSTSTDSGSSTTTTPSTTTPSTTTTSAAADGATAAGGIFSIQVTVVSTGPLADQITFLKAIHTVGPRRALVTGTTLAPVASARIASVDGRVAMTTQLTVFSAPQTPTQIAQLRKLLSGDIGN